MRKNNSLIGLAITVITLAAFFFGCDKKKDNGSQSSSSGQSSMALILASSSSVLMASHSVGELFTTLTSCNITIGSSTQTGNCFTPLSIKSKATQLNGASSFGGLPIRLLNFSAAPEGSGYDGPFGILGVAPFDFSVPQATTNPYSDDNIQDGISTTVYNRVTVNMKSLELQIEIPSANSGVTQRFWTIRYPFIPQDLTSISGYSTCLASDSHLADVATAPDAKIYSAPANFLVGDVLLCQKAASTDVCADSDFEYISSTDGSTSSTRPSSPVRLSGTYLLSHESSCAVENGHPNMSLGYIDFDASLTAGFKATRVIDRGVSTYTITSGCEGTTCNSGTASSGNAVVVTVTYSTDNSIFVPTGIDLTSDSASSIRQNLYRILIKPLYVLNNRTGVGNGDAPGISATTTFSLSTSLPTDVKNGSEDF